MSITQKVPHYVVSRSTAGAYTASDKALRVSLGLATRDYHYAQQLLHIILSI